MLAPRTPRSSRMITKSLAQARTARSRGQTSLAENFHRLAMNPADEAQAFATRDRRCDCRGCRRFGLTVRLSRAFASRRPVVPGLWPRPNHSHIAVRCDFDQEIQARVFTGFSLLCFNPDSIRRMVLSGTVRQRSARARLVGRDADCSRGRIGASCWTTTTAIPGSMLRC